MTKRVGIALTCLRERNNLLGDDLASRVTSILQAERHARDLESDASLGRNGFWAWSRLDNGLGFYRFVYDGEEKAHVGVMAQEVRTVVPEAVVRGHDGYFRVLYDKLGLQFQTYEQWLASGARIPVHVAPPH